MSSAALNCWGEAAGVAPRLKVAFVLPSFAGGGAQRVLVNLAMQLDRASFEPSFIVFEDAGPWRSLLPADVRLLSLDRPSMRAALLPLLRVFRQQRPDVVVSTLAYVNMGVLLLKPFLRADTRVVLREANTPRRHAVTWTGRAGYALGYRLLYRLADAIISPPRYLADELVSLYGIDRRRIVSLANPVDVEALREAAGSPRRRRGGGLRLVAVGRLVPQKGFDCLLDDFAKLPSDAMLTIFGDGEMRAQLEHQAARLGLQDRVILPGFEPSPAPWLAGADALVLPSRWEGMPNVALEALACGTPVIATPTAGGIAEIMATAEPGAVTIASTGTEFVSAMCNIAVRPCVLHRSLLPEKYRIDAVCREFAALLTRTSRPKAA